MTSGNSEAGAEAVQPSPDSSGRISWKKSTYPENAVLQRTQVSHIERLCGERDTQAAPAVRTIPAQAPDMPGRHSMKKSEKTPPAARAKALVTYPANLCCPSHSN